MARAGHTSEVTFVDSYAIAFLLQTARCAHEERLPVSLPDPPAVVRETLHLADLDEVFTPAADEAPAVPARGPTDGSTR